MERDRHGSIGELEDCHYVILRLDGTCAYRGDSEALAAQHLEPGTVFGRDPVPMEAYGLAMEAAARARAAQGVKHG
jgi:hypothetical protein